MLYLQKGLEVLVLRLDFYAQMIYQVVITRLLFLFCTDNSTENTGRDLELDILILILISASNLTPHRTPALELSLPPPLGSKHDPEASKLTAHSPVPRRT